jgi:hypothetical protein
MLCLTLLFSTLSAINEKMAAIIIKLAVSSTACNMPPCGFFFAFFAARGAFFALVF